MTDKVSVYIPTYRRDKMLLERGLKSVLEQTYDNMQIIVVNHGESETTRRLVEGIPDSRIEVIDCPRTKTYQESPENHWFVGRVVPSNAGIAACTGDWIATNDDDDIWDPNLLSELLGFAKVGGYDFVSAGSETHEGKVEPYDFHAHGVKVGALQTWLYKSWMQVYRFNPNSYLNETNKVCDTDLQARMVRDGVNMGYLDKVLVKTLPRPGETEIGSKAAFTEEAGERLAFK